MNSLTHAFALSTVIVHESHWLDTLNQLVSFRRFLRDEFGLHVRDELKAAYLIHNTGPFQKLKVSEEGRMKIFRMALRLHRKIGLEVFAVVVDKDEMRAQQRTSENPMAAAWERTYERLETFTRKKTDTCMVFPDEGPYNLIRGLLRAKRRHSYVPSMYSDEPLSRPAQFILEDPSMRRSTDSYFIQMADLVAYAAHRRVKPQPWFDESYWDQLGDARIAAVSKYTMGDPLGIKLWPPTKRESPLLPGAKAGILR